MVNLKELWNAGEPDADISLVNRVVDELVTDIRNVEDRLRSQYDSIPEILRSIVIRVASDAFEQRGLRPVIITVNEYSQNLRDALVGEKTVRVKSESKVFVDVTDRLLFDLRSIPELLQLDSVERNLYSKLIVEKLNELNYQVTSNGMTLTIQSDLISNDAYDKIEDLISSEMKKFEPIIVKTSEDLYEFNTQITVDETTTFKQLPELQNVIEAYLQLKQRHSRYINKRDEYIEKYIDSVVDQSEKYLARYEEQLSKSITHNTILEMLTRCITSNIDNEQFNLEINFRQNALSHDNIEFRSLGSTCQVTLRRRAQSGESFMCKSIDWHDSDDLKLACNDQASFAIEIATRVEEKFKTDQGRRFNLFCQLTNTGELSCMIHMNYNLLIDNTRDVELIVGILEENDIKYDVLEFQRDHVVLNIKKS